MANGKRRHQLIADRDLQGTLVAHTAIYWFYCLFSVTLIAVCWIIFTNQPESSSELFAQLWLNCGPALLGSVLLLPLVLLDCLRLSGRFAGPMVRMQRAMRELAAGESPTPIKLRPGDYWIEFADNLNIVIERLRDQNSESLVETDLLAEAKLLANEFEPGRLIDSRQDVESKSADEPCTAPIVMPVDGSASGHSIYSDVSL